MSVLALWGALTPPPMMCLPRVHFAFTERLRNFGTSLLALTYLILSVAHMACALSVLSPENEASPAAPQPSSGFVSLSLWRS